MATRGRAHGGGWPVRFMTTIGAGGAASAGMLTGHPAIGIAAAAALGGAHLVVVSAPVVVACWIAIRAQQTGADPLKLIQELAKLTRHDV